MAGNGIGCTVVPGGTTIGGCVTVITGGIVPEITVGRPMLIPEKPHFRHNDKLPLMQ